jgi:hypothetical protein
MPRTSTNGSKKWSSRKKPRLNSRKMKGKRIKRLSKQPKKRKSGKTNRKKRRRGRPFRRQRGQKEWTTLGMPTP